VLHTAMPKCCPWLLGSSPLVFALPGKIWIAEVTHSIPLTWYFVYWGMPCPASQSLMQYGSP